MVTAYFRRVRDFFAHNYHQRVRVDGERAMDTLMGTMLGVLFLAVISASFAGIFMAYTVSTAKAAENNERNNLVVKYSTSTLNHLHIESVNGKTSAELPKNANTGRTMAEEQEEQRTAKLAAGEPWTTVQISPWQTKWQQDWGWNRWTVKSHYKALSAASPAFSPVPNSSFAGYTFAATRPMVKGGTTLISQWGKNESPTSGSSDAGLVTVYTAIAKAGVSKNGKGVTCDWTQSPDFLEANCIVSIDSIQSVVAPPIGVRDEKALRWENEIVQYPWTASTFNWADNVKRDVKTQKLGVIDTSGIAPDPANPGTKIIKYVVMVENLEPGKKVSIDFVESTSAGTLYSNPFIPQLEEGESGKVARSSKGTLNIPIDANNLTVYIDTDVDQTNTVSDQTVKINRFVVYNMK